MHPLLKGFLITCLVILPLTVILNVTEASQAVIAPVIFVAMGGCALISVKIYADSKPR